MAATVLVNGSENTYTDIKIRYGLQNGTTKFINWRMLNIKGQV